MIDKDMVFALVKSQLPSRRCRGRRIYTQDIIRDGEAALHSMVRQVLGSSGTRKLIQKKQQMLICITHTQNRRSAQR